MLFVLGIAQYEANDRKTPVRVFQWKQLENLYFRDKKFSIEVHDAKRVVQTLSSFNLYEDVNRNDKVPFIYYVSTFVAQNLIALSNFSQELGFFVKAKEFLFQHYILTKFSCCSLKF
jgi:D-Tyr-tRNAtyr deacylase